VELHTVSSMTRISALAKRGPRRVMRARTTLEISGRMVVVLVAMGSLVGSVVARGLTMERSGSGLAFVEGLEVVDGGGGRDADEVTGPAIEA